MEQNKEPRNEMNPCIYGQLLYDKGAKNILWGKNSLFNMLLGKLNSHMQKNKVGDPWLRVEHLLSAQGMILESQ